ncbi:MAG TPA: Vms1/Ankzf1 family peptidyl-tRNA hydrolase [Pyrinomonadaceae bacterium]|nr:Vms1/Ankzf1 family peptidyl-tRNA hydrolase [Pyrinomonadaceae bacterium]
MAQSGAAGSETLQDIIERLADFEPVDLPFISLYLNAQANEHGRADFDRFLRKEFNTLLRTYEEQSPARASFERDVERINAYLADELRPESNGVAIFACAGADEFFQAVQFEAPVENHRLYIYNQPHLYPLARLMDQYPRYAVLVADTNRAQLFVFARGKAIGREEVQNVKTRRSQVGGWSQARYQRHNENYHLHHAKELTDVLERVVREDGIEHIILAGDEQIIPLLREQFPKAVEEKVVDVLSLDINTPEHEVFTETLEVMRGHDAMNDFEKVQRLFDAYRSGGLAVVGSQDTLEALSMGQVEELLITASQQHVEGDKDDVAILSTSEVGVGEPVVAGQDGAVAELDADSVVVSADLVARAHQTAARVTFIEDPTLLAEVGGVGALLRYRITPPTTDSAPQPQHA